MSNKKELKRIREKINELDAELLKLINQRSSLAIEAGEAKEDEVIYKPEREATILRNLKENNPWSFKRRTNIQYF